MTTRPEITCGVILDLLPPYQEGTCSAETKALVEQHLEGCAACRQLCEAFPLPEPAAEQPEEKEVFRRVQRRIRTTRTAKALAALAVVLIVGFAGWNAVWFKTRYLLYRRCLLHSAAYLSLEKKAGKGLSFGGDNGVFDVTVKMPGYLGFESGFLSVQRCPGQKTPSDTTLFLYPRMNGETEYMVMIMDTRLSSAPRETCLYGCQITKELAYIPDPNLSDEENAYAEELLQSHQEEITRMKNHAETVFGLQK